MSKGAVPVAKSTWITADWDNGPLQDITMPQFQAAAGVRNGVGQTQGDVEVPIRFDGVIKNLSIRMGLNQFDCRWAVHINSSDSALTIEGVSPATGVHTNTTDRVDVSPGDLIVMRASVLSGSGFDRFDSSQFEFEPGPGVGTITHLYGMNLNGNVFQNDSDVEIFSTVGEIETGTQATTAITVREAGVWSTGYAVATVNSRTIDSEIKNRINGSTGSILITITAGMTGQFEDSSGSDAVADGDEINWQNENFTGGGNWTNEVIASFIERTADCWSPYVMQVTGHQTNSDQTADNPLGGSWKGTSADDSFSVQIVSEQVLQRNETTVSANSLTGEGAFSWVQVDSISAGNSPSLLQITAGMTGRFQSLNQQRLPPGSVVRVRNQGRGGGGSWNRRNNQGQASPGFYDPLFVHWDMPQTQVAGGGR